MSLIHDQKPKINGFFEDNSLVVTIMSLLAVFPANFWTLLRLLGVYYLITAHKYGLSTVFLIFLALVLTDFIDGKVARIRLLSLRKSFVWLDPFWLAYKSKLISKSAWKKTGAWFDPMVDKVFILSFFYQYGVVLVPIMDWWFFASLALLEFCGRLIIIPVGRKLLRKPLIVEANFWGKLKFSSECFAGFLIFMANYNQLIDWTYVAQITLWLTLGLSIFSIVNYIFELHDPWKKS